jgi:ribosome-associated translation inhibitor RaiA
MGPRTLPPPIQITERGGASHAAAEYARHKLSQLLSLAPAQVLYAHAVLTIEHNPACTESTHVEVSADVSGTVLHARAAGATLHEATDRMAPRLRRQLEDLRDRYTAGLH